MECQKENVILFLCYGSTDTDGASVMLGWKLGVAKQFIYDFCNDLCLALCLELFVSYAVAGVNHLHIFCDKLYLLYHRSPKNQDELISCAQSLPCQLL